jgi:hypothetical protein
MDTAPKRLHGRMTPEGEPVAIEVDGRLLRVEQRRHRIDVEADLNWFEHVYGRVYWEVMLENGQLLVAWHDSESGEWYADCTRDRGHLATLRLNKIYGPKILEPKRNLRHHRQ